MANKTAYLRPLCQPGSAKEICQEAGAGIVYSRVTESVAKEVVCVIKVTHFTRAAIVVEGSAGHNEDGRVDGDGKEDERKGNVPGSMWQMELDRFDRMACARRDYLARRRGRRGECTPDAKLLKGRSINRGEPLDEMPSYPVTEVSRRRAGLGRAILCILLDRRLFGLHFDRAKAIDRRKVAPQEERVRHDDGSNCSLSESTKRPGEFEE